MKPPSPGAPGLSLGVPKGGALVKWNPPAPDPLPPPPLLGPATLAGLATAILGNLAWGRINGRSPKTTSVPGSATTIRNVDDKWEDGGAFAASVYAYGFPSFNPTGVHALPFGYEANGGIVPMQFPDGPLEHISLLSAQNITSHPALPNSKDLKVRILVKYQGGSSNVWVIFGQYGQSHEIRIRNPKGPNGEGESGSVTHSAPGPDVGGKMTQSQLTQSAGAAGGLIGVAGAINGRTPGPSNGASRVGATGAGQSSNAGGGNNAQSGTINNGKLSNKNGEVTNLYDNRIITINNDNRQYKNIDNSQTLNNAGELQQQQQPGPQTTNRTVRVYNEKVYESTDTTGDLDKIAEEVGRIEKKVGDLLERTDAGELFGNLGDLLGLLTRIWDFLTVDRGGVTYSITAPCEKDADGNPITIEREIGDAEYGDATCDRLDAIADLLAFMMASKHRTCAPMATQPTNNVTITAYEVMEE